MATKTLTKEQWADIENQLRLQFGVARLLIDGYKLTLQVETHKRRLLIVPYVNGQLKGIWLGKENEHQEQRRFYRLTKLNLYTRKQKEKAAKMTKKMRTYIYGDIDKTIPFYESHWPTFAPLKRHLEANNDSIELCPED